MDAISMVSLATKEPVVALLGITSMELDATHAGKTWITLTSGIALTACLVQTTRSLYSFLLSPPASVWLDSDPLSQSQSQNPNHAFHAKINSIFPTPHTTTTPANLCRKWLQVAFPVTGLHKTIHHTAIHGSPSSSLATFPMSAPATTVPNCPQRCKPTVSTGFCSRLPMVLTPGPPTHSKADLRLWTSSQSPTIPPLECM